VIRYKDTNSRRQSSRGKELAYAFWDGVKDMKLLDGWYCHGYADGSALTLEIVALAANPGVLTGSNVA
jgi:hypothetical protein